MLSNIFSDILKRRWLDTSGRLRLAKRMAAVSLLFFISPIITAQPNITRVEYYVDTDPGYGNGTAIAIAPANNLPNLSFTIDVTPLSQGVHIAGVRSRDVNGAWSVDNKWLFVKPYSASATAIPNVNRVEWFLDTDPGYGNGTTVPISPGQNLAGLSFSIPIPPLFEGVHIVGVRSRDANGAWSEDNRWLFVKPYSTSATTIPNITRVEWFLDTDPGYGNGTPLSISPGQTLPGLSFMIDIPPLFEGVHIVGIRSRDANGAWSVDNRWLFVKPYSVVANTIPNITRVEWYLDTDPGYGNATSVPISPGQNLSALSITQNLAGLVEGVHIVGIRSRDAKGAWSTDNRWLFVKPYNNGQPLPARNITRSEYYLDVDPGYGKGVPIAIFPKNNTPGKDIFANISAISAGKHYFFIRSKDDKAAWSYDYIDSFTIAAPVSGPQLVLNSVSKTAMCVKDSFDVGYDIAGTFNAGNTFKAYLSNNAGSFAAETEVGTITSTTDNLIKCKIPDGLPDGAGYKIRVKSSNPAIVSATAEYAISVYDRPFFGNDTTVFVVCADDEFNLYSIYNPGGYTLYWNAPEPSTADTGVYKVIAINFNGCSDTVNVTVKQDIALWTGTTSTSWHIATNWSTGKVPNAKTHVIIPAGKPNCVVSTADATAASVQVKPGAVMNVTNSRVVVLTGTCSSLPPG